MEEITISELMQNAKDLTKHDSKWHFHLLTPECIYNERRDKHALILEDSSDNRTYVAYSATKNMKQGETLLKMLYGRKFLEEIQLDEEEDPEFRMILRKAKHLNAMGVPWHHHMLFPECIFNKHKDKWCILFEDPETKATIESFSQSEPKEKLAKIEALFYKQ